MRRSEPEINVVDLVNGMETFGCEFYFRPGGTLFVRDLAKAPNYLIDQFIACNPKELVWYIRNRQADQTPTLDQAA